MAAASNALSSSNRSSGQGSQSDYNGQSQLGQSGSHHSGTPGPGVSGVIDLEYLNTLIRSIITWKYFGPFPVPHAINSLRIFFNGLIVYADLFHREFHSQLE